MSNTKNKHFVASNKHSITTSNKRVGAKAYTGSNDLVVTHNGMVITRAERKAELNF